MKNNKCKLGSPRISDQKKHIKIISWNIQGIYDKLAENDLIEFLFDENDIILLTETHTKCGSFYDLPNFTYKISHINVFTQMLLDHQGV